MDILIDGETKLERQHTNSIRIKALQDVNKELSFYLRSTNIKGMKWWYNGAIENNVKRMELYN